MKRTRYYKPEKVILTNDPSMTAWGWAVVDLKCNVLACGCIKTQPSSKLARIRKSDDRLRRVSEIVGQLNSVVNRYNVGLIVSEAPHGSQNAQAAVMIGMVAGILQTFSDLKSIPIEWYSEADAKKSMSNKKLPNKQAMVDIVSTKYTSWKKQGVKYQDEAVADALAVHNVALMHSNIVKWLQAENNI